MCAEFFQNLFGGGSKPAPAPAPIVVQPKQSAVAVGGHSAGGPGTVKGAAGTSREKRSGGDVKGDISGDTSVDTQSPGVSTGVNYAPRSTDEVRRRKTVDLGL